MPDIMHDTFNAKAELEQKHFGSSKVAVVSVLSIASLV